MKNKLLKKFILLTTLGLMLNPMNVLAQEETLTENTQVSSLEELSNGISNAISSEEMENKAESIGNDIPEAVPSNDESSSESSNTSNELDNKAEAIGNDDVLDSSENIGNEQSLDNTNNNGNNQENDNNKEEAQQQAPTEMPKVEMPKLSAYISFSDLFKQILFGCVVIVLPGLYIFYKSKK